MEGLGDPHPVPAVQEPEITSDATTGRGPAEPTAYDGSRGGDESAASCPWSLTHEQQVYNLKEKWKTAGYSVGEWNFLGIDFVADPWFSRVVAKLRVDPCLDSCELEIDQSPLLQNMPGVSMNSLDLAILMGDLKMVQKILERSFVEDNVLRTPDSVTMPAYFFTPLHLAVTVGDSHIVDAVLEKGADVKAQNWLSQTPLDLALMTGNVTMLQQLLAKDRKKKNPLHVAVQHGDVDFMKKLPSLNANATDRNGKTPLHYLATQNFRSSQFTKILQYLAQDKAFDMKAVDKFGLSAFYVAVLCCNTEFVIAVLESFKDQIRLNEACDHDRGPPIQIASEGGFIFRDIERALMECDPVKSYIETMYRDRQVYVDAANAILVGAALIGSVTFASWLQPPLSYTSYFGEGYSSSLPAPSTSNLNYVDVEHNIALHAFWVFNALSFYFAIGTVVCGARSVLPRSHLFIKKLVEQLRINLLLTSILLACSVLFVMIAFAIAGTIVLTPLVKYQWYMIVPTIVGGMVCLISLFFLVRSLVRNFYYTYTRDKYEGQIEIDYLRVRKYKI